MRTLLLFEAILVASLWLSAGCARSQTSQAGEPVCATPATAGDDGCAGSHPTATTRYGDFFTGYAAQSRQHAYRTRPPWNVAGVDYPVGYYTPLARLIDVRKSQPKGCALKDWQGTQALLCDGAGSLRISGYRFDRDGGTWLMINGAKLTSIEINDSYFLNGPQRIGGTVRSWPFSAATPILP